MESQNDSFFSHQLHIVMLPWLAMGHIIPFLHLSKRLARRGHKISFLSTPRNLQRLPKITPNLSHNINLVPVSFSQDLPDHAESSTDLPFHKQHLLRTAADTLQTPIAEFVKSSTPDWIITDYAFHWLRPADVGGGVPVAYFGLFTAATLAFLGPPEAMIDYSIYRSKLEDFTVVPDWIPFESHVVYRLHEIMRYGRESSETEEYKVVAPDMVRIGVTIKESDVVIVRSCIEFEPEWIGLLSELYQKPVFPVGFLPPTEREEFEFGNGFTEIKSWLDKQRVNSVLYVALGTEASLFEQELKELALGLEKSELPFFWVLRLTPDSTRTELEKLPDGFLERVKHRGVVFTEWAPQVEILSHDSVGGYLTHCGCNSVIEGLALGRVLVMLPVLNEQGLNARLLEGKRVGVEVPRKDDGSFTSDSVAESVRLAMLDESGELLRRNAKKMKDLIGNKELNERYVDGFFRFMEEHGKNQN